MENIHLDLLILCGTYLAVGSDEAQEVKKVKKKIDFLLVLWSNA